MQFGKCVCVIVAYKSHRWDCHPSMCSSVISLAFPFLSPLEFANPSFTHVLSFVFELHWIERARNVRKQYAGFQTMFSLPWPIFKLILKCRQVLFLKRLMFCHLLSPDFRRKWCYWENWIGYAWNSSVLLEPLLLTCGESFNLEVKTIGWFIVWCWWHCFPKRGIL